MTLGHEAQLKLGNMLARAHWLEKSRGGVVTGHEATIRNPSGGSLAGLEPAIDAILKEAGVEKAEIKIEWERGHYSRCSIFVPGKEDGFIKTLREKHPDRQVNLSTLTLNDVSNIPERNLFNVLLPGGLHGWKVDRYQRKYTVYTNTELPAGMVKAEFESAFERLIGLKIQAEYMPHGFRVCLKADEFQTHIVPKLEDRIKNLENVTPFHKPGGGRG